ncbi:MAG TPA: hypothetical protein VIH57_26100 [Bacteroidales bacterium]
MLKAGALPYAILISLLIIAICTMLIEGEFLNAKLLEKEALTVRLNDNIESGVNIFLCKPESFDYKKDRTIFLFDDTTDRVVIRKKLWGAFDLVKIEAQVGLTKVVKNVLIGSSMGADSSTALRMGKQNEYLYVAGKTTIKGNCFVPGGIIKTGQIEGRKFEGTVTAEGTLHESTSDLPEINNTIVNQFDNYMVDKEKTDSLVPFEKVMNVPKEIDNSFENKTLIVYSDAAILLSRINLAGNIIVRSEKMVEIDSSARLQDVIIYAPKVFIRDYFKGIVQVFASDTVNIGKNCRLKYPSFVSVISKGSASIQINEGTKIQGAVFFYQKENSFNRKSQVLIGKGSEVTGCVYSNTSIDHQGKISGIIYCNGFVLRLKTSLYENYLLDAEIDAGSLPKFYVGPIIFKNSSNQKLIEWLN